MPLTLIVASLLSPLSWWSEGATPVATLQCTIEELDRRNLQLARGSFAYVEPRAFGPMSAGLMLAGSPSYEWDIDADGRGSVRARDPFFGVYVEGGEVRPIDFPPGVEGVEAVRGLRLDDSAWGFVFAEPEGERRETPPARYAEYRSDRAGYGWTVPQELPTPPDGQASVWASSHVMRDEGRTRWATIFFTRPGRRVLVYTKGERWTYETAAYDWAEDLALTTTSGGDVLLALGALDPEFDPMVPSLRIHRRSNGWTNPVRIDQPVDGSRSRDLVFARGPVGSELGWLQVREGAEGSSAWIVRGIDGDSEAPPRHIGSGVHQIDALELADGSVAWVTHRVGREPGEQLIEVHVSSDSDLTRIGSIRSPFLGPYAVALDLSGDLFLAGPEVRMDPQYPFVRSLILRLRISCL